MLNDAKPQAPIEIVLIHSTGTVESFVVTPWQLNQFYCLSSPEFMTDFRILHGDIFEAEKLTSGNYRLIRIVQSGAMRHFRVDLGLYMLPMVLKDQPVAKERAFDALEKHFDDVFISNALKTFLVSRDGYWEVNEFFQYYSLTLHISKQHATEFFERLPELCTRIKPENLIEIFTGECDD
jgi:hypothetical protein